MPTENGKRTRLLDRDLATLARDGHTPEEIGQATGVAEAHIKKRLRDLGLGYDGQPADYTRTPPTRKLIVTWYADDDTAWLQEAACVTGGHHPELWFPRPRDVETTAAAKRICAACPVKAKCLDGALKAEGGSAFDSRDGIFGGLTVRERMALQAGKEPPIEMSHPVRCGACRKVHDAGHVQVIARYADCSVWHCPNCNAKIDDRPKSFGGSALGSEGVA